MKRLFEKLSALFPSFPLIHLPVFLSLVPSVDCCLVGRNRCFLESSESVYVRLCPGGHKDSKTVAFVCL